MESQTPKTAQPQAGVSLMEVLLVIAIVAFLVVGGLTLFTQAQQQGSAQRAQQQLTNLSSSIRGAYAGQPTYVGMDEATLYALNAVPDDMNDGAGTNIINAFGANVAVSFGNTCGNDPAGGGQFSNGYFCIDFPGLTQETCQRMVASNVGSVAVGTAGNLLTPPVQVADVATVCSAGQNTIRWVFSG